MGSESSRGQKPPSPPQLLRSTLEGLTQSGQNISAISENVKGLLSAVQVAVRSSADLPMFATTFMTSLGVLGIATQMVITHQSVQALQKISGHLSDIAKNVEAQTALQAPEAFAQKVHRLLWSKIESTKNQQPEHWFFVYHTDTDWLAHFQYKLKQKRPLGPRFIAVSHELDALIAWMLAIREVQKKRPLKPIFHLLMPAYRPMVILDPLVIPDALRPFHIEGEIHAGTKFVWLNLPQEDPSSHKDIEIFTPETSLVENIRRFVGLDKPPIPRVLGSREATALLKPSVVRHPSQNGSKNQAKIEYKQSGTESQVFRLPSLSRSTDTDAGSMVVHPSQEDRVRSEQQQGRSRSGSVASTGGRRKSRGQGSDAAGRLRVGI